MWLARSHTDVPPNRGAVAWKVRYLPTRAARGDAKIEEYVLTPDSHHALLPHDLAPGDEVVTRISLRTPRGPGEYRVEVGIGALRTTPPSLWETVELESPLTVR